MYGVVFAADGTPPDALAAVAREFSPRLEICVPREIVLDLSGLERLFGDAREIASELRRTAADRGLRIRVAIAATRTAARLLARHRAGITVVEPGTEAATVAPLPLTLLGAIRCSDPNANDPNVPNDPNDPNDLLLTLRHWGLRTLGDFAALPADDVAARLGQEGVACQRLACGEDERPLLPSVPDERFEQALELEWPIEGLEPLSFVLGRLLEPLEAHLARRGRGAAVLHVRLRLVSRMLHERSLQLPTPIRDARTLRTLALLDLESHPPEGAIDAVMVAVDPTPARIVQFSLLTRPLPSPEQVSTLLARLAALMGEGRCGSPAEVDSWKPGAFAMRPFAPADHGTPRHRGTEEFQKRFDLGASVPRCVVPGDPRPEPRRHGSTEAMASRDELRVSVSPWPVVHDTPGHRSEMKTSTEFLGASVPRCVVLSDPRPSVALRRFRFPVPARVYVEGGKPSRVTTDRRGVSGGRVVHCGGPWRTSGEWWAGEAGGWDRDEWDATFNDGTTYRLFRERATDGWFVEGIVD